MRIPAWLGFMVSAIVPPHGQPANTLTRADTAAHWQLMFDGKSLAGWHSYRRSSVTNGGWIVQDSAIYLRGNPLGGFAVGGLLAPEQFTYKNFEISIDWKLSDSGNSGIFLRYLEMEEKEARRTGPETQICGKLDLDYLDGIGPYSPGACYDMYAPARPWIRPASEYNTLRVVMYENKVAHFGNGVRLLEYTIGDSTWKARYAVSKYHTYPLYGDIHAGKLFLQDHASHVWYRNIKIRVLEKDPWSDPGFIWADQEAEIPVLVPRGRHTLEFTAGRSYGGRIGLRSAMPRAWDLRILDPLGRRCGSFRGAGEAIQSDARVSSGLYLITGGAGSASALSATASSSR